LEAAKLAAGAARTYGKGSGHPAQLNFGDCLSYGVARARELPLLYVGNDFHHTDITAAL
jgi:ribonuclease VapC